MIETYTDECTWWFRFVYRGMNIDVQISKDSCRPETAMAWATWHIVRVIEDLDDAREKREA